MKLPNQLRSSAIHFNMTPMIDVVFLLIIFFLLSSHLARQENQVALSLPTATTGEDVWDETTPRVTLNVLPDGVILLNGRRVSVSELVARLQAVREELGARTEMRVRADREVAYRHISPILAAATQSGLWSVTFAVIRPEDQR